MKSICLALLVWGLSGVAAYTGQAPLESFGEPFDGRKVNIIWDATNQLPERIDVFKVVATEFSSTLLSNIVSLCGFKDPAKAMAAIQPAAHGKDVTYNEPFPGKPVLGKSLRVAPRLGYITFTDPTASSNPGSPVEGVPTEKETLDLTLRLLPKLGIQEADLSHKPFSSELERYGVLGTISRFDKEQKKRVETANLRGVILFRQVGGISFSGPGDCGGLRVEFGNHGKIKELAMSWRKLRPERKEAIANAKELIRWIQEGKAVIRLPDDLPELRPIRTLTIHNARPYYFGNGGEDFQKYVFPYVAVSASGDMGYTNVPVTLSCPIVDRDK